MCQYSYDNLNLQNYFLYIKYLEKKNSTIEAVLNAEIAVKLLGHRTFLHIENEDVAREYFIDLFKRAKLIYPFPFKVNVLNETIEIYALKAELVKGSYYPLVFYRSNIPLQDAERLTIENNELNKKIEVLYPGIDKISDTILYNATNGSVSNRYRGENQGFVKMLK